MVKVEKKFQMGLGKKKPVATLKKRTVRKHKAGFIGLNVYSYYIIYKPLFEINRRFRSRVAIFSSKNHLWNLMDSCFRSLTTKRIRWLVPFVFRYKDSKKINKQTKMLWNFNSKVSKFVEIFSKFQMGLVKNKLWPHSQRKEKNSLKA